MNVGILIMLDYNLHITVVQLMVATQSFFFQFSPPFFWEDEPNMTSIFFQMGWFNHQLVVFHPLKCKLHKQVNC